MKNKFFDNIKGNFGFGCMRFPMKDKEVDYEETCKMIDTFMENGFNYFDTAHGYLDGKSEIALKECSESEYWIELLIESGYYNDKELLNKCIEVKRILIASINTAKENTK